MAVFEYTALNEKGKKTKGIIDADGSAAAQDKLRMQHIFPITLSRIESQPLTRDSKLSFFKIRPAFFSRPGSSEMTLIIRQLATLLSAGFPLVKAISTLMTQTGSKTFRRVLSNVKDALEEGSSFADALSAHPHIFSDVFVNMINAGETSGTLEVVLERLADFSEKKEDTRKKIQAALAYPLFMTLVGVLVLIFLLTYIVPGIIKIFADASHTLPLPTRMLLAVSGFLADYWWAVILMPFILGLGLLMIKRTKKGGIILDRIILEFPVLGSLFKKLIAARFTRTLGSLLENGVPLLTALHISKSIAGNRVVEELVEKAARNVEQGGAMSRLFEQSTGLPDLAVQMIKVGEKSGEMEQMLEKSADLFDRDVSSTITAATAVVEPVIILVMGVVIGFIILAVCLPIFEINQLIGL